MSEFTKGKWEVQDWTEKLDGEFLPEYAVCVGDEWIADCADNEANARLIAAAPEMYELLKVLVQREYDNTVTAILALEAEKLLARIDGKEAQS